MRFRLVRCKLLRLRHSTYKTLRVLAQKIHISKLLMFAVAFVATVIFSYFFLFLFHLANSMIHTCINGNLEPIKNCTMFAHRLINIVVVFFSLIRSNTRGSVLFCNSFPLLFYVLFLLCDFCTHSHAQYTRIEKINEAQKRNVYNCRGTHTQINHVLCLNTVAPVQRSKITIKLSLLFHAACYEFTDNNQQPTKKKKNCSHR